MMEQVIHWYGDRNLGSQQVVLLTQILQGYQTKEDEEMVHYLED